MNEDEFSIEDRDKTLKRVQQILATQAYEEEINNEYFIDMGLATQAYEEKINNKYFIDMGIRSFSIWQMQKNILKIRNTNGKLPKRFLKRLGKKSLELNVLHNEFLVLCDERRKIWQE